MTLTATQQKLPTSHAATTQAIAEGRRCRTRRFVLVTTALTALVVVLAMLTLCLGETTVTFDKVLGALLGTDPSATFTVVRLRLPRALIALAAGVAFGMAGRTFQVLLRNPLASPDIIGITSGTTTAAVFAILVLGWTGVGASVFAVVSGLVVAAAIWALANVQGRFSSRMILIGIGTGALFHALTSWLILRANSHDVPEAMRWLTGSLTTSAGANALPLLITVAALATALVANERALRILVLGRELAIGLGQPQRRTEVTLIALAVAIAAVATAATGPITFVAFLAGPIAASLIGANERSLLVPAGLVGAALILLADLIGQNLLPFNYPVGVVTGLVGAPVLLAVIARAQRKELTV